MIIRMVPMPTPKIFIVVSSLPLIVMGGNQCRSGHPTVTHRIRLQLRLVRRPKERLKLSSSVDFNPCSLSMHFTCQRRPANESYYNCCFISELISPGDIQVTVRKGQVSEKRATEFASSCVNEVYHFIGSVLKSGHSINPRSDYPRHSETLHMAIERVSGYTEQR
jgi:hypothetical protein